MKITEGETENEDRGTERNDITKENLTMGNEGFIRNYAVSAQNSAGSGSARKIACKMG